MYGSARLQLVVALLAMLICVGYTMTMTRLTELERQLDTINKQFLDDAEYTDEVELIEDKVQQYKAPFIEIDQDLSGDIDVMELKRLMEKLGQAKTFLELKGMIAQLDLNNSGTIDYNEFLVMMLGNKNSVLKLILKFEARL